jgi:molybdopterin-binding protein
VETVWPGRVASIDRGVVHVALDGGPEVEVAGRAEAGDGVLVCVRPEHVIVSDAAAAEGPSSVRNHLKGVVRDVVPLEGQFRVTLDCGGVPLVALVTVPAFLELRLGRGRPVVAAFKATAAHLIPAD